MPSRRTRIIAISTTVLVTGVGVAIAQVALAPAMFPVAAYQVGAGSMFGMNTATASVDVTGFHQGTCPNPRPFGTPYPIPQTIPGNQNRMFIAPVGPFVTVGPQYCDWIAEYAGGPSAPGRVTVQVMPTVDTNNGCTLTPPGLAFGAVVPGDRVDLGVSATTQAPMATANWSFSGPDATTFQMVSPCQAGPGQGCSGGLLYGGAVLDAVVACAPGGGALAGWRTATLRVNGYMTANDSITMSCDVRSSGTQLPDAAPSDDAGGGGQDGGGGGDDGGGDDTGGGGFDSTNYYACGCDGGTGGIGMSVIVVVAAMRRRRHA